MKNDWYIVKSKSNSHPEFGYPHGQILCKGKDALEDHLKTSDFKDLIIQKYNDEN